MKSNKDFIPIFIKENISYSKIEDNNMIFISKLHPELQKLEINKQSKDILELCNGSNTINDIINIISTKFQTINVDIIEKDCLDIIHKFWKLSVVGWRGDNPFDEQYKICLNDYEGRILSEDDIIKTFHCNENNYNTIPTVDKDFILTESNLRQRAYFGFEQWSIIKKENKSILYSLLFKDMLAKSCYINFYGIDNVEIYEEERVMEIIKWSIEKYRELVNINVLRIDTLIVKSLLNNNEYLKLTNFITKLGFKKYGDLKQHILIDDNYHDIELYSYIL